MFVLKDDGCGVLCAPVHLWKGFCGTGAAATLTAVTTLPKKTKQKINGTLLNLKRCFI